MSDLIVMDEVGTPDIRALWKDALRSEGRHHDVARMERAEAKRLRRMATRIARHHAPALKWLGDR